MTRSLGLHLIGDRIAYALVESLDEAPPQVLAAGRVRPEELREVLDKLDAHGLPWCVAGERDGAMIRHLPSDFPLRARNRPVLTPPAAAAAQWEWSHGRIDRGDLYLWLSPATLHWSRGLPGRDRAGSVPREGPLRNQVKPALGRAQADRSPVVAFVEGDAPGGEVLEQAVQAAGHPLRALKRPAEEMGTDPAAAGAALIAVDPNFPARYRPERIDRTRRWRDVIGFLILLTAGAGIGANFVQQQRATRALEARIDALDRELAAPASAVQPAAAPPPAALTRLLQRRQAVHRALSEAPETEGGRPVRSLRIVTDAASGDIVVERERTR